MWPFKTAAEKFANKPISIGEWGKYFSHYELDCWEETNVGLKLTLKRIYKDKSFELYVVVMHNGSWRWLNYRFAICGTDAIKFITEQALPLIEYDKKVREADCIPYAPKA